MRIKDREFVYSAPKDALRDWPEGTELTAYKTCTPGIVLLRLPNVGVSLTHELSGTAIMAGFYPSMRIGRWFAGALGGIADWTKPGKEVVAKCSESPCWMGWIGLHRA